MFPWTCCISFHPVMALPRRFNFLPRAFQSVVGQPQDPLSRALPCPHHFAFPNCCPCLSTSQRLSSTLCPPSLSEACTGRENSTTAAAPSHTTAMLAFSRPAALLSRKLMGKETHILSKWSCTCKPSPPFFPLGDFSLPPSVRWPQTSPHMPRVRSACPLATGRQAKGQGKTTKMAQQYLLGRNARWAEPRHIRSKMGEATGGIILSIQHPARHAVGAHCVLSVRPWVNHCEVLYFLQSQVTEHLLYVPRRILGIRKQGKILFLHHRESVSQRRRT